MRFFWGGWWACCNTGAFRTLLLKLIFVEKRAMPLCCDKWFEGVFRRFFQLGLLARISFDSSSAMAGWIVFGALVVGVALLRRCGAIVALARRSPSWNWRGLGATLHSCASAACDRTRLGVH